MIIVSSCNMHQLTKSVTGSILLAGLRPLSKVHIVTYVKFLGFFSPDSTGTVAGKLLEI